MSCTHIRGFILANSRVQTPTSTILICSWFSSVYSRNYLNLCYNRLLPGVHKPLHIHRPTARLHIVSLLCSLTGREGILYTTMMYFQHLTGDTRVQSQANHCQICGGQSGTVTGVCPSTSVFPRQYHSKMLHTHSFTYHPHYTMFLSQYFSFPLSVPFHQCSIPIHSPTTHTI